MPRLENTTKWLIGTMHSLAQPSIHCPAMRPAGVAALRRAAQDVAATPFELRSSSAPPAAPSADAQLAAAMMDDTYDTFVEPARPQVAEHLATVQAARSLARPSVPGSDGRLEPQPRWLPGSAHGPTVPSALVQPAHLPGLSRYVTSQLAGPVPAAAGPIDFSDVENVMYASLLRRNDECYALLEAHFPLSDEEVTEHTAAVVSWLQQLQHGGASLATVAQRCLQVLQRPRQAGDQSGPFELVVPPILIQEDDYAIHDASKARRLVAVVYAVVQDFVQRCPPDSPERQNIRVSFLAALSRCLEDDGHRICFGGARHQLIGALRGYALPAETHEPAALLSHMTVDHSAAWRHREPSSDELQSFYEMARAQALDSYRLEPGRFHSFVHEHLLPYLFLTYDGWQPQA